MNNAQVIFESIDRFTKIQDLLGVGIWDNIRGKVVVDFGCGRGTEAIELAQRGAQRVYGVDIVERLLAIARKVSIASDF